MRIAHLCLSAFYIDGVAYQENQIVREHVVQGHEVLIVASTETFIDGGKIGYVDPVEMRSGEGARLLRLPYRRIFTHFISRKVRAYPGVIKILEEFKPDAILFHGTCAWELLNVTKFATRNPQVKFYIDSHEDSHNSARSFFSREVLHRRFYGPILRRTYNAAQKILCVSLESIDFVESMYRIPRENLEFYPLGGNLISDEDYARLRVSKRAELGIKDDQILLVQSGKQTVRKKLIETLRAFKKSNDQRMRLVIAGSLFDDIRDEAEQLIAADDRVSFLGWQSSEQMDALLCAADIYVQPGTQSATMQHSLCCRCAVIIDDVPSHEPFYQSNGWLVRNDIELARAFSELELADLEAMKTQSFSIAEQLLDYKMLANRILV